MQFVTLLIFAYFIAIGVEGRSRGKQYDDERDTIVELPKLGAVQGKVVETAWTNREVLQFVDMRYAEPPTGQYRFKVLGS